MDSPNSRDSQYFRSSAPQGVPVAITLLIAAAALLLGLVLGRNSAASQGPASGGEGEAVNADVLQECRDDKERLTKALERAGSNADPFSERQADSRRRSSRGRSSDNFGSSSRGGDSSSPSAGSVSKEPRLPDVREWSARVEMIGNGPDLRAWGRLHNRENRKVEGLLHLVLTNRVGERVDDATLALVLDPGLNQWQHVFRWAPYDDGYDVGVRWETMGY